MLCLFKLKSRKFHMQKKTSLDKQVDVYVLKGRVL